jgi:hypothetical protein
MDKEPLSTITPEAARASLAEVDRIATQIRQTIAWSRTTPLLILWGVIWVIGFAAAQYFPPWGFRLWTWLDIAGVVGSVLLLSPVRRSPIKGINLGLGRISVAWLALLGYGTLWAALLCPWELSHRAEWAAYAPLIGRKIAAFSSTVCMFGYLVMGLWLGRFFLWLGLLVTATTLVGYYFVSDYFFLWMALTGGGSLIAAGVFIRKFWR